MDKFIKTQLEDIETSSHRMIQEAHNINLRLTAIFGYSAGQESGYQYLVQNKLDRPALSISDQTNKHKENISDKKTIEDVKEMIIELKIKGSVRQRQNGLIEFRSTAFGSIYGKNKEDIKQKIYTKLKKMTQEKQKYSSEIIEIL